MAAQASKLGALGANISNVSVVFGGGGGAAVAGGGAAVLLVLLVLLSLWLFILWLLLVLWLLLWRYGFGRIWCFALSCSCGRRRWRGW